MSDNANDWLDTAECAKILGTESRCAASSILTKAGAPQRGGPGPKPVFYHRADVERIAAERAPFKRQKRGTAPEIVGGRPCMCCSTLFKSDGPHNRLCSECRAEGGVTEHTLVSRRK